MHHIQDRRSGTEAGGVGKERSPAALLRRAHGDGCCPKPDRGRAVRRCQIPVLDEHQQTEESGLTCLLLSRPDFELDLTQKAVSDEEVYDGTKTIFSRRDYSEAS